MVPTFLGRSFFACGAKNDQRAKFKARTADRLVRDVVHAYRQRRIGLEDHLRLPGWIEQFDTRELSLVRAAPRAEAICGRIAHLGLLAAVDIGQVSVDHLAGRSDEL